jgi:hypothetical protein
MAAKTENPEIAEIVQQLPGELATMNDAMNAERSGMKTTMKKIPFASIVYNLEENFRVGAGQKVGGVTVTKDEYNVDGLVAEIVQANCVREPVLVWHNPETKKNEMRRGFRRTLAIEKILRTMAGSPLAEKLKEVDAIVVTGIDRSASLKLVNDQNSKAFSATAVFREFAKRLSGGERWDVIAYDLGNQITRISGSEGKWNEIKSLPESQRLKAVATSMNAFVNQLWRSAILSGLFWKEMLERSYMIKDGLLDKKAKGFPANCYRADGETLLVLAVNAMKEVWKVREQGFDAMLAECRKANGDGKGKAVQVKASTEIQTLAETNAANGNSLVADVLRVTLNKPAPDAIETIHKLETSKRFYHTTGIQSPIVEAFIAGDTAKLGELLGYVPEPEKPLGETETA